MPRRYKRKRKSGKRRRSYGIRKRFRRRSTKITRWGVSKYNIHRYRRYGRGSAIDLTSNASGWTAGAMTFKFTDMTNFAELGVLYDQCRLDYVTIKFMWSPKDTLSIQSNNGGLGIAPVLYYFKDYDDSNSPASLANMKERGNLRQVRIRPFRTISLNLKPAVLQQLFLTNISSATAPKWGVKMDIGSTGNLEHLGLKWGVDYIPNQDLGQIKVETVYHITMFGTR